MSSYATQQLIIGSTPVGFDDSIIRPNSLTSPTRAFFIVENNSIRVSSVIQPTETSGLIAPIGSSVVVRGQKDIEDFKAISTNPSKTSSVFVEFTDEY